MSDEEIQNIGKMVQRTRDKILEFLKEENMDMPMQISSLTATLSLLVIQYTETTGTSLDDCVNHILGSFTQSIEIFKKIKNKTKNH